jgi:hypothetical protein
MCRTMGLVQSMGTVGDSYDNGLYALDWGDRVRIFGGAGRCGHVTPPAWRSTRRR